MISVLQIRAPSAHPPSSEFPKPVIPEHFESHTSFLWPTENLYSHIVNWKHNKSNILQIIYLGLAAVFLDRLM